METNPQPPAVVKTQVTDKQIIRTILYRTTFVYTLFQLLLLIFMHLVGERYWLLSILIYLPVMFWLLPLGVLTPFCLIYRPKLCLWHLGCLLFTLFYYQTFHWNNGASPKNETLILLTNNIANNNRQSVEPYIKAENPDIIALQEATGRSNLYAKTYPDRFVSGINQFVLISKFPIISTTIVNTPLWLGQPVAARFEISVHGENIAVYSIHLPTPRPDFVKLRGTGWLRESLGPSWNRKRSDGRSYRESMAARVELARGLVSRISEEKEPFFLMGDFNMPDCGYIHSLFSAKFEDAFASAGRGWGLTFPGFGNHAFLMRGPWLRIDYLFAGRGWKTVDCHTEPDRRSKHRAVVARFERLP